MFLFHVFLFVCMISVIVLYDVNEISTHGFTVNHEAFVEPDQKSYRSPLRTSGYGHGHSGHRTQDQSTHLIGLVVDLVGLIYLVSLD